YDALAAPSAQQAVDFHVARVRHVLGADFNVLPRFKADGAAGSELATAFAEGVNQGATPGAVSQWLLREARIREGVARLETVLLYRQALRRDGAGLLVGQIPYDGDDSWVALAATATPGGRVSLVVAAPPNFAAADNLAGLTVDEWTEVVPSRSETTGVTFHYHAPNTEPPHGTLLAVPPAPRWRRGVVAVRWS